MDDQGCPRCKTTKYRNPSLKLMVNVCGHTLCENCVEMLFVRGSSNCVQCDTPLRKSNFRLQLFEDPAVDKEVEIRKKVLKIYNKRDLDFPSLREYNDYLEQVEEIVFNLTNNVDVENTRQMMEQYQRDNKDVIQRNKAKLTREQEELEELLLMEQQDLELKRLENLQEEQRHLHTKRKNKQALLDELESSHLPASLLLAQHKERAAQLESQIDKQKQNVKPAAIFSTGILMLSESCKRGDSAGFSGRLYVRSGVSPSRAGRLQRSLPLHITMCVFISLSLIHTHTHTHITFNACVCMRTWRTNCHSDHAKGVHD
ncbi:CDK-activating kinase assembly factor MAT1 isoform X1 [Pangasianodon hypophthalmus]|uniref:CDK-activating kinase assembly factor MAT1 isoform X1 n=1 Tax=Pangasianodon hypophthalmus TaxID=310915 RepID=UPI002307E1EA|nr:CDK-activating kinase assembly factor MAT1 isoform X1 [Pangasianodon hypophthalmus]